MKLSIIIPLKNQTEKVVGNIKNKIIPFFDPLPYDYLILISPNGSEKEEDEKLRAACLEFAGKVRVLPLAPRGGKGLGVKLGIEASEADYDLIMDADLATDLSAFALHIAPTLGEYDAYVADRDAEGSDADHGHLIRRLAHRVSCNMIHRRFGLKEIRDTQCGFKCYRHSVALLMAKAQRQEGIAYDVEHAYFLTLNHYKIKAIPVLWENDKDTSIPFFSASRKFSSDLRDIKKHREDYILKENSDVA